MPIYALDGDAPQLPEDGSVFVAPGAHVIGRVRMGRNVGVWFGAVIRGDNEWMEIGEGTNIQDNSTLHSDFGLPLTIGAGCTIGHGAIVHGCTIGDNVLVGMGATILNGAVIGSDSIVGANALVTEGKTFPERSLIVGSPARAIRTLDDATIEKLKQSAADYVGNAARFARTLEDITK
ncbi:Carbonic anhydrase or acetyltransferase, isoleucine patch superfamily [Fulvimarina manganoxydans]|uniref:Carbonic anhydrase or acetyltransferase, isoleucine patch superfamily n=1 Tax=Fulvimarina manganoxydans TaxID=937218 RepID=A0A1W2BFK1_9HYPH|nr:gamma carbonic anhydrase family protein [Fulvimarina manganoxydans]SMC71604.1 Carbonic anhydrase or acetyltransferase, isoleucine patch superfamily [Fulvimarina manganoxydans]